ncbi:MAG: fumarylacetoacetate hydrolase family protein [Planctomycetaceae bacterium]|nr:fumarylacetoacetate hydrolase family protein [Planctomycetaceae bacterium]
MKLAKVKVVDERTGVPVDSVAVIEGESARVLSLSRAGISTLAELLHSEDPRKVAEDLSSGARTYSIADVKLLAPIDYQEVWAAGVTYKRSQIARMEESETGASHYDLVYTADRPEIFFKATPNRVVHPGEAVRVRHDSDWTVPEPEFTLVLNPKLEIVAYTIGNDMSARDIEGENPLYLPQAKVYRQCCALGPYVLLADEPLALAETKVELRIHRSGEQVFQGDTNLGQLHRKLPELAEWLGKEDDFPTGAFLLTGTGIVPDDDFSLEDGDEIEIEVTGIGVLRNSVVKGQK